MNHLTARTSTGKIEIQTPENWAETSVDQYQKIIGTWDKDSWIQLFSLVSGIDNAVVSESTDPELAGALYKTIEYVYTDMDWDSLPVPKTLELRPIFAKDCPGLPVTVFLPKGIGNLSIGQAIQARQSIEGLNDIREGISIVTAIYLQPLIDGGKFDMLRAIEIERTILKMSITKVYPVGFFLLMRLTNPGRWRTRIWSQIKRYLRTLRTGN